MTGGAATQPGGLSVGEAALRLAPLAHLLEGLSRRSGGWLDHLDRIDQKIALADHLADDARSAAALSRRVAALDPALPGAPAGATRDLLRSLYDCSSPAAHLALAYGVVKPLVAEHAAAHLEIADPLIELPTVSLLLVVRSDQERHIGDLPQREPSGAVPAGPLAATPGEPTRFSRVPPTGPPGRDPFITRVADRPSLDDLADALHALLNACVAAGERAARAYHDRGEIRSAERAALHLRHAALADRLLGATGTHWGERPVGPPHEDPYAVAQVIAVQHPQTALALEHMLSERD